MSPASLNSADPHPAEPWLEVVRRLVTDLRFGSVSITVHEGRVTQVEAVQRTRFAAEGVASPTRPRRA
jgi:hypothetical protein